MPNYYPFAQVADRTLGLVLFRNPDPKNDKLLAMRFRRSSPFKLPDAADEFEKAVEITHPFSFEVSVKQEGLLSFEAAGWGIRWICDLALPLGVQNGFASNQMEFPALPNWPATTDGPDRSVKINFLKKSAVEGRPAVTWSTPNGLAGIVPFRDPKETVVLYGVAIILRLRGNNAGQLDLEPGNPWGDKLTIKSP